jgi:prepilin-type N-terminal cleavage/methylation domain-containing protein
LIKSRRIAERSNRGFTLVELLAVVVIMALMSLLAVGAFRRDMQSARGTEAVGVMLAIRSAETAYLAENHTFLDVSTTSGGTSWYPQLVPSKLRAAFSNSNHPDYPRWVRLAPTIKETVMFSYLVNAGPSGTIVPSLQMAASWVPPTPQPVDWYVIQASGDVDGNGVFSRYASSSINGELYVEREGE